MNLFVNKKTSNRKNFFSPTGSFVIYDWNHMCYNIYI